MRIFAILCAFLVEKRPKQREKKRELRGQEGGTEGGRVVDGKRG